MIQKTKCNIILLAIFGFGWTVNTILAQDHTADSGTSSISLVEVPSRRIAYVEHIGPYWAIGRVMAQTQKHMANQHHGGPLFIRYKTNPGKTQPQKLVVEIGFVLDKNAEPHLPYLTRVEPEATAITWSINEPTVSPRAAYAQLQQWAKMHDLTPVGPMIELHNSVDSLDSKQPTTTLEFQMPLVSSDSTALAKESQSPANPKPNPRTISSAKAIENEPFQGYRDSRVAVINEANKIANAKRSIEKPPSPGQPHSNIPDVEADSIVSVLNDADSTPATPPAPSSMPATTTAPTPPPTQPVGGNEVLETARAKARGSGESSHESLDSSDSLNSSDSPEKPADASDEPIDESDDSIESLFASGEYDKLAMLLMSDQPAKSNATIVWLGQLSFRISAAAKGIQDQYPNDAEPLLRLSHALRKRHAKLADSRNLDTLERATVQSEAGNKTTHAQLAQIMRRVDRLLAGIAFKRISPDDANREVVNLLTQVNDLFSATAQ